MLTLYYFFINLCNSRNENYGWNRNF